MFPALADVTGPRPIANDRTPCYRCASAETTGVAHLFPCPRDARPSCQMSPVRSPAAVPAARRPPCNPPPRHGPECIAQAIIAVDKDGGHGWPHPAAMSGGAAVDLARTCPCCSRSSAAEGSHARRAGEHRGLIGKDIAELLPVTITLGTAWRGATSCMAAFVDVPCGSARPWDSRARTSFTTSRHRMLVSEHLALSTEHSLPERWSAVSKPRRGDARPISDLDSAWCRASARRSRSLRDPRRWPK